MSYPTTLDDIKTRDDLCPSPDGPRGLREMRRGFWWGNGDGPLRYKLESAAALAGRILDVRMGPPAGRTRPHLIDGPLVKTQTETPKMTGEDAVKLLESGRTL